MSKVILTEEIAVAWDLDGTAAKTDRRAVLKGAAPTSRRFQTEYLKLTLPDGLLYCRETGNFVTPEQFATSMNGTTMLDSLHDTVERLGRQVPADVLEWWDVEEQLMVTDDFMTGVSLMPRALTTFRALNEAKYRQAIVSSSVAYRIVVTARYGTPDDRDEMVRDDERITDYVSQIVTAQGFGWERNGDGQRQPWVLRPDDAWEGAWCGRVHSVANPRHYGRPLPKPEPASYHLGCHFMKTPPSHTVSIEDSKYGIAAATRAGIALRIGFVSPEVSLDQRADRAKLLTDYGATDIIYSLDDVVEVIEEWRHGRSRRKFRACA